ncbi:MAG: YwiC-like family protein [Candidatus Latescibacteria bacterium]|nr:YwiC-like family protein [Candidatus Latescibacterota bacterium]
MRLSRPPFPHEHGAWVMLYAPLVIVLAAVRPVAVLPSLFLILTVTSVFLGQYALRVFIRRRGPRLVVAWLGVELTLLAAGLLPLLFVYRLTGLLAIGALAAALFGLHTLLLYWPSRKRLDRSQWGETLAVGALALTAPAAYVVARGGLDPIAWSIWAACVLYFSSGIFYVNMLLSAARIRGEFDARDRWRVGRDLVVYHVLLILVVGGASLAIGGWAAPLAALAYVPVLVRAFWGWATLSNELPPLTRVGLREVAYTLWFTGVFVAALRSMAEISGRWSVVGGQ